MRGLPLNYRFSSARYLATRQSTITRATVENTQGDTTPGHFPSLFPSPLSHWHWKGNSSGRLVDGWRDFRNTRMYSSKTPVSVRLLGNGLCQRKRWPFPFRCFICRSNFTMMCTGFHLFLVMHWRLAHTHGYFLCKNKEIPIIYCCFLSECWSSLFHVRLLFRHRARRFRSQGKQKGALLAPASLCDICCLFPLVLLFLCLMDNFRPLSFSLFENKTTRRCHWLEIGLLLKNRTWIDRLRFYFQVKDC